MGEWKASISPRIAPALRVEMEEFAAREYRSLGNLTALLIEWAFKQLKAVGATERLLKLDVRTLEDSAKAHDEHSNG